MRVLKKLYQYKKEKEQALLSDYGWEPNAIEYVSGHNDILQKLYLLKQNPLLTKKRCLDAFSFL